MQQIGNIMQVKEDPFDHISDWVEKITGWAETEGKSKVFIVLRSPAHTQQITVRGMHSYVAVSGLNVEFRHQGTLTVIRHHGYNLVKSNVLQWEFVWVNADIDA